MAAEAPAHDPKAVEPAAPSSSQPSKKKVLVVGDENLLFSTGLQEAYPEVEVTAVTVLAKQNLDAREFNSFPPALKGRVRHMMDPTKIGKNFPALSFDDLLLFLPGLSFAVPKELGTADRPLFAYRTHHFVFHVLRMAKLILKDEGNLHLVWPEETGLMSSPCGAAGIEMVQLLKFLGCKPAKAQFTMELLKSDHFWPFVFGEVPKELPEWLDGAQMHAFSVASKPIEIPLAVALQLHPDMELVAIKDASPAEEGNSPPAEAASLKAKLIHEALARKARLKDLYGPKESEDQTFGGFNLVKETLEQESFLSLLAVPLEVFMLSFDEVPHIGQCMRFQILEDQPPVSIAVIDLLDPRLPTRVARPAAPTNIMPPAVGALIPATKKRSRPKEEVWGEMKFYCSLTKICTPSAEKMRSHMQADLYKRFAARNPDWEASDEKKDLIIDLEEAEAEEQAKRAKRMSSGAGKGSGKSKGKGDKGKGDGGKGGGSKGKGKGKDKGGAGGGGKSGGKGGDGKGKRK